MGSEIEEIDFAKEAKKLLEGGDSYFDSHPMRGAQHNEQFVKMIFITPKHSVLPKELKKLMILMEGDGFPHTKLLEFKRDDGKIMYHFTGAMLHQDVVDYVKDFYDWVVKE
jgi:hypothetical protein